MRTVVFFAVAAAVLFILSALLVTAVDASAQLPGYRGHGWATGSDYNRCYDVKTVQTVGGEVIGVERVAPRHGMSRGVQLLVKTHDEVLRIHLGPAWFMDSQTEDFKPGDRVEVLGSRVKSEGRPVVIAAEVKKGSRVLRVRDHEGAPRWDGWTQAASSVPARAETPLYQTDLDRHLWSWGNRRRFAKGYRNIGGRPEPGRTWRFPFLNKLG